MIKHLKKVLLFSITLLALSSCKTNYKDLDKVSGDKIIENNNINIEVKAASLINIIQTDDSSYIDPINDDLEYFKDSDKYIFDTTELYLDIYVNEDSNITIYGTYINELKISSKFNSLNIKNNICKYISINESSINELLIDCSYSDTCDIYESNIKDIKISNDHITNINLKHNVINDFSVNVVKCRIIFTNNYFINLNISSKVATIHLFLNDKYAYNLDVTSPDFTKYVYSSKHADKFIKVNIKNGYIYAGYYHD